MSKRLRYAPDPKRRDRVVAALVAAVPDLTEASALSALTLAGAASMNSLRSLDIHLTAYTGLPLTLGTAPPLALVRLAEALADAGFPVPQARCARCASADSPLRHLRKEGRICDRCSRQDHQRTCARCGRHRTIAWRAPDGDVCDSCWSKASHHHAECAICHQVSRVAARLGDGAVQCQSCYQRPQDICADCGEVAPVKNRTERGPLCLTCYQRRRRARLCGRCGRLRLISRRASLATPDMCYGCDQGVEAECSRCGRRRPGHRLHGEFRCRSCLPRPLRECARCHQQRAIATEWPLGPVCQSCYDTVRNSPGHCAGCLRIKVLTGVNPSGDAICGPCAGTRDYACASCNRPGFLYANERCQWCVLDERVRDLLTGSDGTMREDLTALHAALINTDKPKPVLRWLQRGQSSRLLATLAGGPDLLTHELLDQFAPAMHVHYLRDVLILAGVLPARDEHLDRVAVWLRHLFTDLPRTHLALLQPFAQWDVLHRARRRSQRLGPRTAAAAAHSRRYVVAAARFLEWLSQQQLELSTATQQHLDHWLTTGRTPYDLRRFIHWANKRGLTHNLVVPTRRNARPSVFLTEEHRWGQLRECLNNTGLPTRVRAAGALILLLGVSISRVVHLTTGNLLIADGLVHLTLGRQAIPLPPRVGALLAQLVEEREPVSALKPASHSTLLFPGRPPSRPLSPQGFSTTLIRHGITAHTGRNSALLDLAADVPAPILAGLLGITASTAARWNTITGRDWTAYLQARGEDSRHQDTQRSPKT